MKVFAKYIFLFTIGGLIYYSIEMMWRGYSCWQMVILGGICFIFCGSLNEFYDWDMPITKQMFISSIGITALEFISGYGLNVILNLNIWDYSRMPFNIIGQICLPYSILWFLLSGIAIILDDYLRYWFFRKRKPTYKLWRKS